jgi:hypothetical protein
MKVCRRFRNIRSNLCLALYFTNNDFLERLKSEKQHVSLHDDDVNAKHGIRYEVLLSRQWSGSGTVCP